MEAILPDTGALILVTALALGCSCPVASTINASVRCDALAERRYLKASLSSSSEILILFVADGLARPEVAACDGGESPPWSGLWQPESRKQLVSTVRQ